MAACKSQAEAYGSCIKSKVPGVRCRDPVVQHKAGLHTMYLRVLTYTFHLCFQVDKGVCMAEFAALNTCFLAAVRDGSCIDSLLAGTRMMTMPSIHMTLCLSVAAAVEEQQEVSTCVEAVKRLVCVQQHAHQRRNFTLAVVLMECHNLSSTDYTALCTQALVNWTAG